MKQTVNIHDFRQAFIDCGREGTFTYEGLAALFEWIEQYEEDCGAEIELDVIALCCEYSEYESAMTCVSECGYDAEPSDNDAGLTEEDCLEYLRYNTQVIEFNGGIIICDF